MTNLTLPAVDIPPLEYAGLKAQYASIRDDLAPRLQAIFEHGMFVMGPEIQELEKQLAERAQVAHAIGVSSGTDALLAPLLAWGVGPGDAVFVPSFTFTATPEVVVLLGATPVFVDVHPRSFNIDVDDLARWHDELIRSGAAKPKAVISVDLFGSPADYDALTDFCEKHGLLLLADAAQSFGASFRGRPVGSLAPVTATSFFPSKPLGCYGDGGSILTDDDDLADQLRSIRAHGEGAARYDIVRIGLNARLDSIQAAVLLSKLKIFSGELTARDRLADYYGRRLGNKVAVPYRDADSTSAWAQYSILSDRRDALQQALKDVGVPTAIHYPKPLHLQPAYERYGRGPGSLAVSERLCTEILCLPMHGYMEEETADRICSAVESALNA